MSGNSSGLTHLSLDLLRHCATFLVGQYFPKECKDIVTFAGSSKGCREACADYLTIIIQMRISQKNLQVNLHNFFVINNLYFSENAVCLKPELRVVPVLGKVVMYLGKDAFVCKKVCKAWSGAITNWQLFSAVSQEYRIIVVRRASTSDFNERALLEIRKHSLEHVRRELDSRVAPKNVKFLKHLELTA